MKQKSVLYNLKRLIYFIAVLPGIFRCPTGFSSISGDQCEDINECKMFPDICGKHGFW